MEYISTPPPRPSARTAFGQPVNEPPVNERPVIKTRMRWDTVLTVIAAAAVGFAVGVAVAVPLILAATPAAGAVNEDPYGGAPVCTDVIADAGGVCHGEPVNEDVPVAEVAPPVAVPPATLPACATEDSDNCYWDGGANGEGRSFVTLDGTTYYQDVPVEEFGSQLRTVTLNGQTVPYVDGLPEGILYCTLPLKVGIDVDDNGNEWAGCM
jgi:uncharacterized membrane protein